MGGRQSCVIPLTRAIPECIRGGYDDALHKSTLLYLFYLQISSVACGSKNRKDGDQSSRLFPGGPISAPPCFVKVGDTPIFHFRPHRTHCIKSGLLLQTE